jgi:Zn-finger nucleic acid-binding protein
MKCPICKDPDLVISDRQGVEIDYCPRCRGVWLDRGELDKIIDRADRDQLPAPPRRNDDDDHRRHEYRGDSHHKKKSFWHELFD